MEKTPPKGRGLRPIISFERHWRKSLLVAVLVVLACLPIVWIKGKSYYMAEAVFQVWPTYQKTLSADKDLELQSNSQYREFVNHLSRSVLRYDVLQGALTRLKAAGVDPRLPSEDERRCIERLQRTIYVYAIADTYMVKVGLQGTRSESLEKIVNAVMDSFLETTRNEQIYGSDERSRVLLEKSQSLRGEIATFEAQRAQLASVLGLTTFGENTSNPYDALLAQTREKLTQASIERSQAQATLNAFLTQHETPASAGRSVLDMRLQDNGLQALRNEVVKRSEELNRTVAGLEERHPARSPALAEQQDINNRLESRESAFEKAAQKNIQARLTASVMQTSQVEKELREKVQTMESEASGFATNFRDAMRLTGEIRKREQELDDMRNRLNYMSTERNAIGFVRSISSALPATTPQGLGKTKLLLIVLAAAMGITLILPMAFDMLDSKILVVGDAERAMGIESAAWFVQVENEATRVLARDQSRRFASTLMRNCSRGSRKSFAFASVNVGGGASAAVLDISSTLASLGCRVLVVDANSLTMGSPFASTSAGLTDLLAGNSQAVDVIHKQMHKGLALDVVPYGNSRESGIQRLDVFKSNLEEWSRVYDMVLVDIPPILPSADAELLIDTIGQVFVVVEAGSASKSGVVRAGQQLRKISPEAVGLIVNKIPMENGGADLRAQVVETITRGRFQNFMTLAPMGLQVEMLKMRLQRLYSKLRHARAVRSSPQ